MKKAKLTVSKNFILGETDKNMFGVFFQIGGKGEVDQGIYDIGHPLADENGVRQDYIDAMKGIVGLYRYPGGSNMALYRWKDGIGPKEDRPQRALIYKMPGQNSETDDNGIGIDEFTHVTASVGADYMMTVNVGTGTIFDVYEQLEYCLMDNGSYWSDRRKQNGYEKPHNIRYWCIGNEEDGDWEFAQSTPEDYGHKARETAKMIKQLAPIPVKTVLCGTSNPGVTTYPEWDRIVLEKAYEYIDWLSIHYIRSCNPHEPAGAEESPLGIEDLGHLAVELNEYIKTAASAIHLAKAKRCSEHEVKICIDEWAAHGRVPDKIPEDLKDKWTEIVELTKEDYTIMGGEPKAPFMLPSSLLDAVLFGSYMLGFIGHADQVACSCRGGGVFLVAPGMILKTTNYYVLRMLSQYGRGKVLRQNFISPTHETERYGTVPSIQSAAVYSEQNAEVVVFALNINLREEIAFQAELEGFTNVDLIEHVQLWDQQPLAGNSFAHPTRILPKKIQDTDTTGVVKLPPISWNMLRFKVK